jgi:hypothetical protein
MGDSPVIAPTDVGILQISDLEILYLEVFVLKLVPVVISVPPRYRMP